MKGKIIFVILCLMTCLLVISCNDHNQSKKIPDVEYTIDVNHIVGENYEFWKAIGYDFLFKIVHEPEGQNSWTVPKITKLSGIYELILPLTTELRVM